MASITSPGVGSGIDIGGLVSRLVESEGQVTALRIEQSEAETEAEISALGALKAALSSFQSSLAGLRNISGFNMRGATSGDEALFTASASSDAVPGTFAIEVVRLAAAQKLVSGGYADSSATVGSGELTLSTGDSSFTVSIDSGASTLADVRDAINDAPDNAGVSATIITVDDGGGGSESKLVLTAKATGTENEITVTASDDDGDDTDASGLSALVYNPAGTGTTHLGVLTAAVDAQIRFDTQTVTRSSNTIADAIEGVTIELHAASPPGETTELSVALDKATVQASINTFVGEYNKLVQTIGVLSSYDAETGSAGILLGDAMLRGVAVALRRELSVQRSDLPADVDTLPGIGFTTGEDGTLSVDGARLSEALASNFDDLGKLFAGSAGIAQRLHDAIAPYVSFDGSLDSRTGGLNDRMSALANQRETLFRRLGSLEERLLGQFIAMDSIVASLQSTSTFLTQQFDALRNLTVARTSTR